jgi:hypothetical protein
VAEMRLDLKAKAEDFRVNNILIKKTIPPFIRSHRGKPIVFSNTEFEIEGKDCSPKIWLWIGEEIEGYWVETPDISQSEMPLIKSNDIYASISRFRSYSLRKVWLK